MATNYYGKSCTPNIGGVQDYYTKAEINQLFRQRREAEIVYLETGHVLVGNQASVQQQYELDPEYYIVDHDTGSVSNLSADRLRTARTLSLTGVVTGTVQSNLATGFTINTTVTAGSITSAMIADGTITDTDISPTAEIAVGKLADGTPRQLLETAADGTTVQWASNIDVPGTLDVTGEARFDANVTIAGNLTVSGTETFLDVTTLRVEDRNIELGRVTTPTDIAADGGGITLLGDTDKTIVWERATASWSLSEHLNLAAGRSYRIGDVPVLSATSLGSGVQISTDNIPPGTVTNDDLAGSIADTKLLTISTANKVAISALDIDGGIDINAALTDSDLFVVDDGGAGTNRKAAATRITDYVFGKVGGDITISNTGTAAIEPGVIVDADVSATAEIAVSKLANGAARQLLQTDAAGTGVEWTSNVDIPGTLDVTGIATFDTKVSIGAAEPTAVREIGWNTDEGTYDIRLDSNVLHRLGADQTTLCRNNSNTVAIPKGTAVMFAGTVGGSGRIKVAPMVADGSLPGYVFFGVTESIVPAGGDGYVKSFGEIKGIDTNAYLEQSILWCDPAVPGGFTATEPTAPNLKLAVAAVISSGDNGILMVRWDTGRRLADLHDVESNGTTADGDILRYNAALGRWENSSSIGISGNLSLGSSITFEGATANDFETVLSVVDPTADRAISVPDQSGTLLVSGNASIVNEDVSATAAIAFSKLAPLSSANILVGSSGNVATSVSVTGDVTISNTGVTAISSGVIVDADVNANAEIAVSKLANGSARQLLQTAADGVTVQWTSNIDVPGTLDVTGTATLDGSVLIGGFDISESARDIEESRLIRRNATVSIGTPGQVPFGVGPIIPPGMSLVGIGADAYNVIDIYSGSVC